MGGGTDIIEGVRADTHGPPLAATAADDLAVERVADEPMGLTVLGSAAVLAVFAAWLAVALVDRWVAGGAWVSGLVAAGALSWLLAAWWLSHGTGRPLIVLRRGCLLGLVQWIALALAHEPVARASDGSARALLSSEAWLDHDLSVDMVWVSLGGLLGVSLLDWWLRRAR